MCGNGVLQFYCRVAAENSVLIVCDNKLGLAEDALLNLILTIHFYYISPMVSPMAY